MKFDSQVHIRYASNSGHEAIVSNDRNENWFFKGPLDGAFQEVRIARPGDVAPPAGQIRSKLTDPMAVPAQFRESSLTVNGVHYERADPPAEFDVKRLPVVRVPLFMYAVVANAPELTELARFAVELNVNSAGSGGYRIAVEDHEGSQFLHIRNIEVEANRLLFHTDKGVLHTGNSGRPPTWTDLTGSTARLRTLDHRHHPITDRDGVFHIGQRALQPPLSVPDKLYATCAAVALDKEASYFQKIESVGGLVITKDKRVFQSNDGYRYNELYQFGRPAAVHNRTSYFLRDPFRNGQREDVVVDKDVIYFQDAMYRKASTPPLLLLNEPPSKLRSVCLLTSLRGEQLEIKMDEFGGGRDGFRLFVTPRPGASRREIPLTNVGVHGRSIFIDYDGGQVHVPSPSRRSAGAQATWAHDHERVQLAVRSFELDLLTSTSKTSSTPTSTAPATPNLSLALV